MSTSKFITVAAAAPALTPRGHELTSLLLTHGQTLTHTFIRPRAHTCSKIFLPQPPIYTHTHTRAQAGHQGAKRQIDCCGASTATSRSVLCLPSASAAAAVVGSGLAAACCGGGGGGGRRAVIVLGLPCVSSVGKRASQRAFYLPPPRTMNASVAAASAVCRIRFLWQTPLIRFR